jgi:hypothetical protein
MWLNKESSLEVRYSRVWWHPYFVTHYVIGVR